MLSDHKSSLLLFTAQWKILHSVKRIDDLPDNIQKTSKKIPRKVWKIDRRCDILALQYSLTGG